MSSSNQSSEAPSPMKSAISGLAKRISHLAMAQADSGVQQFVVPHIGIQASQLLQARIQLRVILQWDSYFFSALSFFRYLLFIFDALQIK